MHRLRGAGTGRVGSGWTRGLAEAGRVGFDPDYPGRTRLTRGRVPKPATSTCTHTRAASRRVMNVAVPQSAVEGETMSVCPCGGHHDFQAVKENDFWCVAAVAPRPPGPLAP
jgi:hypothetical protein